MANKVVVVVDHSNVFIEGQKFSAKMKGIVKQSPTDRDPRDPSWRIAMEVDDIKPLDGIFNGVSIYTYSYP